MLIATRREKKKIEEGGWETRKKKLAGARKEKLRTKPAPLPPSLPPGQLSYDTPPPSPSEEIDGLLGSAGEAGCSCCVLTTTTTTTAAAAAAASVRACVSHGRRVRAQERRRVRACCACVFVRERACRRRFFATAAAEARASG